MAQAPSGLDAHEMIITYPLEFQRVCNFHNSELYDIYMHGYGEIVCRVNSSKDTMARLEIRCGKHYVFFVDKECLLNNKNII